MSGLTRKYFGLYAGLALWLLDGLAFANTRAFVVFNNTLNEPVTVQYTSDNGCMYNPGWASGGDFPLGGINVSADVASRTVVMDSKAGPSCGGYESYGTFMISYEADVIPGFPVYALCRITAFQGNNAIVCSLSEYNDVFVVTPSIATGTFVPASTEANPIVITIQY